MCIRTRRLDGPATGLLAALAGILLCACGATVKQSLVVASDATHAPFESLAPDGHTVVGMDADLITALGQAMGLKIDLVNTKSATIVPGLVAGKYDLGMSSITDTRELEKMVDLVTYFNAGASVYGIAVLKGSARAQTLLVALQALIADGGYARILAKWGVRSGAISNPVINAAG